MFRIQPWAQAACMRDTQHLRSCALGAPACIPVCRSGGTGRASSPSSPCLWRCPTLHACDRRFLGSLVAPACRRGAAVHGHSLGGAHERAAHAMPAACWRHASCAPPPYPANACGAKTAVPYACSEQDWRRMAANTTLHGARLHARQQDGQAMRGACRLDARASHVARACGVKAAAGHKCVMHTSGLAAPGAPTALGPAR